MLLDVVPMVVRLSAALAAGVVLGINRDLRHKAAGVRTHALVALGGALAILVVRDAAPANNGDALSRVIQGLLTGIGFLGAGVIIHHETRKRVQGLTTAASIWVASILGVACGAAHLVLVGIALVAIMLVLIAGGPLEHALERRFRKKVDEVDDDTPAASDAPKITPP